MAAKQNRMIGKCEDCGGVCDIRSSRCASCKPKGRPRAESNQIVVNGEIALIRLRRRDGKHLWAVVDADQLDKVSGYCWRAQWAVTSDTFYAATFMRDSERKKKKVYLHRFITDAAPGTQVDHRDHDGLNNRISNLKVGTRDANQQNRRSPRRGSRSGIPNVIWDSKRGKWTVVFMRNRKVSRLGFFADIKEAAQVAQEFRA